MADVVDVVTETALTLDTDFGGMEMMAIHAHNVLINDTWTAEGNQRH